MSGCSQSARYETSHSGNRRNLRWFDMCRPTRAAGWFGAFASALGTLSPFAVAEAWEAYKESPRTGCC
jgi:hypothetical protein